MAIKYTKQYDSEESWYLNMNLTGTTVTLYVQRTELETPTPLPTTITNATEGLVTADISSLTKGRYLVKAVVLVNGKQKTFPSEGYEVLVVEGAMPLPVP